MSESSGNEAPKGAAAHWCSVEIGNVSQIVAGGTPPSKDESCFAPPSMGVPWLTPADLSGYRGTFIAHGARDLTTAGLNACSARLMPKGSVLFSSRAPIGYVAIAANEISTNQGFKSFVLPPEIDSRFTYFQLRSLKHVAESMATGTTFKELSGAMAAKLPFLVAPLAEQRRIADKLDTVLARVDAVNDRLARVAPLLKRFRQSVLAAASSGKLTQEWRADQAHLDSKYGTLKLGDVLKRLPRSWKQTSLEKIINAQRPLCYGVVQPGPEASDGVPLVRVQDLDRSTVLVADLRTVSQKVDEDFRRSRVVAGDVLVSVVGTIGRTAVVPNGFEGNIARAVARVAASPDVLPKWVLYWLDSVDVQWWLTTSSREVARKTLNLGDLAALPFAVPEIQEQKEIVRRVELLFAYVDRIEARLQAAQTAAERLTPSLLAKAFRGELVPQDPDDEPASELLRRLVQSRPAKVKKSRSHSKTL
jgi:type I restriction enzyme S subunit